MALIREFNIAGVSVPRAYYVISSLAASKRLLDKTVLEDGGVQYTPSQKWDCVIVVSVFKDKGERDAGRQPIAYLSDATPDVGFSTKFEYDPLGKLPVIQGYEYLMKQGYFLGAEVDVNS